MLKKCRNPKIPAGFSSFSDCENVPERFHFDEGGIAWNDPAIGIEWPGIQGIYQGSASAEGYTVYGTSQKLSDKDQAWPGSRDAFQF